jgi:hypothetical protein
MSMIRSMIEDGEKKRGQKAYLVSGYTGTIIGILTPIPALISTTWRCVLKTMRAVAEAHEGDPAVPEGVRRAREQ